MSLRGGGCYGVGFPANPGRHTPILVETEQHISLSEGHDLTGKQPLIIYSRIKICLISYSPCHFHEKNYIYTAYTCMSFGIVKLLICNVFIAMLVSWKGRNSLLPPLYQNSVYFMDWCFSHLCKRCANKMEWFPIPLISYPTKSLLHSSHLYKGWPCPLQWNDSLLPVPYPSANQCYILLTCTKGDPALSRGMIPTVWLISRSRMRISRVYTRIRWCRQDWWYTSWIQSFRTTWSESSLVPLSTNKIKH